MTTNSKEIKCTIDLCNTPFSLYYFKPATFKNISIDNVSEMKLIAHTLCNIYTINDKSCIIDNSMADYIERKIQEMLELSKKSGYRVLVLNAPFNSIGIFIFGKKFSIVDSFFGGKSDGFYSIAFTAIRKLAKEYEQKMISRGNKNEENLHCYGKC